MLHNVAGYMLHTPDQLQVYPAHEPLHSSLSSTSTVCIAFSCADQTVHRLRWFLCGTCKVWVGLPQLTKSWGIWPRFALSVFSVLMQYKSDELCCARLHARRRLIHFRSLVKWGALSPALPCSALSCALSPVPVQCALVQWLYICSVRHHVVSLSSVLPQSAVTVRYPQLNCSLVTRGGALWHPVQSAASDCALLSCHMQHWQCRVQWHPV